MPTPRDYLILALLLRFSFLTREQIGRVLFPGDKDGSVVRARLRLLKSLGWIQPGRAEVATRMTGSMPCWHILEKGIAALAMYRNDTSLLQQLPPCTRSWTTLRHSVEVSDVLLSLQSAIDAQSYVQLHGMFLESTRISDSDDPSKRFKLYCVTQEQPRRIVCAPDAAFEIEVKGYRRALYLELERGTNTPQRAAASKWQGYYGLMETQKWKLHFPHADFRVLCVAPTPNWRDALRKAVSDKKGSELWLFAAIPDLQKGFLHGEAIYTCSDGPKPLVRPPGPP